MPAASASLITIPKVSAYGAGQQHDLDARRGAGARAAARCRRRRARAARATPAASADRSGGSPRSMPRNASASSFTASRPFFAQPSPTNATRNGSSRKQAARRAHVGPAAEPDHRAVLDDLDPVGIGVVDAQEVVGRALAREHPVVDGVEPRRRRWRGTRRGTRREPFGIGGEPGIGDSAMSARQRAHTERSSGIPHGSLFM